VVIVRQGIVQHLRLTSPAVAAEGSCSRSCTAMSAGTID
jgi:hypothetical protein